MRAFVAAVAAMLSVAATPLAEAQSANQGSPAIDYQGFRGLTAQVEDYRAGRLVSLAEFQRMAREPNTIILDARSTERYREGHIDGAVNLPFTEFTDASLRQTLRDPNVRILIYCNNNFSNNANPVVLKRIELALNIQTFINLYGYGYRNVYELGEQVDFNDPAVRWVHAE
ncbi:rhodanese-like domain-containing protein [Terricaulis sp.]|uniref:rhodanese-like domain-containing protein n=1 Tax=Terricaulis sp. TaxID=2768686 RepID=UPI0037852ECF